MTLLVVVCLAMGDLNSLSGVVLPKRMFCVSSFALALLS